MFSQRARRFSGGLLRAVDQTHIGAEDLAKQWFEQGIMRAAKNESVDVGFEHRLEVLAKHEARGVVIRPSLLDEWNEKRTCTWRDQDIGIDGADGALICA